MPNTRIGQQPLDVALADHEHGGHGHGEDAEREHDALGELGFAGGIHDLIAAQDGQKGAVGQTTGQ
jgi:hypothetical protein